MTRRPQRKILHVDMDAFYASIEQRDHPELRGQPLVVGGTGNRGVVAAASYEARQFGVRSAMPMREALARCANLRTVRPRMSHYQEVSLAIFGIFREFTPLVEGLSLDEAFLEVTDSQALFGPGEAIAKAIKQRILESTGLTASVGVATNKLVAKIASDLDKPDGITVIVDGTLRQILDPLPVSVLPGVGRETLAKLKANGIHSIANLRTASDAQIVPIFRRYSQRMRDRAAGIDDRPVLPYRPDKSISTEETFDTDLAERRDMDRALLKLAERTASRLRNKHLAAGTLQVKIRAADFSTYTRQRACRPPTDSTDQLYAGARALLGQWLDEHPGTRIRLLGIGGSALTSASQGDLFEEAADPEHTSAVDKTVDEIRERFGAEAVGRARILD